MDVKKIPQHIKDDLIARGLTEDDMAEMSAERAFHEFCEWHGMHGWATILRNTLDMLREADKVMK